MKKLYFSKQNSMRRIALFYILQIFLMSGLIGSWIFISTSVFNLLLYAYEENLVLHTQVF